MDFFISGYIINCLCLFLLYLFVIIYLLINFKPTDYIEINKIKNNGINKNYMLFYNLIPFFTLYYIIILIYFFNSDNNVGFKKIFNSFENTDIFCNIFKLGNKK